MRRKHYQEHGHYQNSNGHLGSGTLPAGFSGLTPLSNYTKILECIKEPLYGWCLYLPVTFEFAWGMDPYTRRNMASLRLVNKTLHRLATSILFKYFNACFPSHRYASPDSWAAKLLEISKSQVVDEIRYLSIRVGYYPPYYGLGKYICEAAFVLPPLVHACKKLTGLKIRGPQSNLEIMNPEADLDLFVKTVEQIFRGIAPSAQYRTLQVLELNLPLTGDFAMLGKASGNHSPTSSGQSLLCFMKDLKHLRLKFSSDSDLGLKVYSSAVQSERNHMYHDMVNDTDFFHFATLPDRLHTLSISATYSHKMDMLEIENLRSLHTLFLRSVKISQENLAVISGQNVPTLKSITLDQIELTSGTWESTLLDFCFLPCLQDFWVHGCGYALDGTSHNLALDPHGIDEAFIELLTLNDGDKSALGTLQRQVNHARTLAGYEPVSEDHYRFAKLQSTETLDIH